MPMYQENSLWSRTRRTLVGARKGSEGRVAGDGGQADFEFAIFDVCGVAKCHALCLRVGRAGLEVGVERRERVHEVVHREVRERRRIERRHVDVVKLEAPAEAAREDEGLARHVDASEVVARVLGRPDVHLGRTSFSRVSRVTPVSLRWWDE